MAAGDRQEEHRLDPDDAAILALESPVVYGHTAKLVVVEANSDGQPLDLDWLRERIAERVGNRSELSRMAQRVEAAEGDPLDARWVTHEDLDISHHVRDIETGRPLDLDGLRAAAAERMATRLDHGLPLWSLESAALDDGSTALFWRIHHCMADGLTSMRMIRSAVWDADDDASTAPPPTAHEAATGDVRKVGERISSARGVIARELAAGRDTILDKPLGPDRELAMSSVSLEKVKRIGHSQDPRATVNDVVLAGVTGGLREWLPTQGGVAHDLRAQVPVSLHSRDDEGEAGNRDSFLNVDLPLDEPDPRQRLALISAETRERKQAHDAESLYSLFHALARFRPLYERANRAANDPRRFALSISNVPGPRGQASVGGHRVVSMTSFAEPADRHALRIAVTSLGDSVAIGLCSDPEAVGNLGDLAEAITASVDELEGE